jgi:co-chaperonin GroES (HSP10)
VLFADKTNDSGYVTIQREDQELKDAAGIYFQQQQQQQQQQPQVTNLVKKN